MISKLMELANNSGGTSVSELLIRSVSSGEISWADAENHSSIDILRILHQYVPREYPERSETLKNYVSSRLNEMQKRDQYLAVKNGEWIQTVIRFRVKNVSDYEVLMWSGRNCKKIGALDACKKIRAAVMLYVNNYCFFERPDFSDALVVQEMDSRDRQMAIKR